MRLELRTGERDVQLDISKTGEGYTVAIDGEQVPLEVLNINGNELDLRLQGQRYRALVASQGETRWVFLDGRVYTFRRPAEVAEGEEGNNSAGPNVVSQMPSTIVKLLVEPGQVVAEGDGLLIIESMKMETEVTAPMAGTIAAVHVTDGQTVGMNESMVDITPAGEAAAQTET